MTSSHSPGRVALVTGAASGIGLAVCTALAKADIIVVLADTDAENGHRACASLRDAGATASFTRTDVSEAIDVEAMVGFALETHGRLDVAVNGAGVTGPAKLAADLAEADWARVLAVNLTGAWLCMKAEIPAMIEGGGGVIVNVSSTAGLRGGKGTSAYSASKHGLLGLTKSAALEYARMGVRINAVCPGATDTPMLDRLLSGNPQLRTRLAERSVLGRYTTAEEVAATVLWLCSDAAASVIGQAIAVDGGATA